MPVTSRRFSIAVYRQGIPADNIYAAAAVHMNSPETCMLAHKSCRKQSQDLCLGEIPYQADVKKPVLKLGLGTKFYSAAFLFHVHSGEKIKPGQPVYLFFIDPDRYRTTLITQQKLQGYKDVGEFPKFQPVQNFFS